jgi:signal transduction histidine kinase
MSHVSSSATQQAIIRRLTRRYLLALSILAVLTVLGHLSVQLLLTQQKSDASLIDTAAMQVSLSERLSKDTLVIQEAKDNATRELYASDLAAVVSQWRHTRLALQNGDAALGLPGHNSPQVAALFRQTAPHVEHMLDAATNILAIISSQRPGTTAESIAIPANVQTILLEGPDFTQGMSAIIAEYKREAVGHITTLQFIEWLQLGAVLVALVLLALVLFRPVTAQVGTSVGELVRAQEREHELAALKDMFIMDANHELRTPIMSLYNNLEILQMLGDDAKPEQRAQILEQAIASGDTVLRLLTNVLDTSVLEGRAPRLELGAIILAPLVRQVLETLDPREVGLADLPRAEYEARPVSVSIEPELTVLADEGRLRQILINLLANALKYSAFGTPIEVRASLRSDGQSGELAQISVSDRGLGVPPSDVHKLFHRFVRLQRDIAGPVRGTGLGLYLCRVLVEAMGGQIWVESTGIPGEGSTFSFTLPLARRTVSAHS